MESASKRKRLQRGTYYGWTMLCAVSFTEMVSWGILYYSFTVFIKPMQASLGWSTAELSGAFSLALLCSGGSAFLIGGLLDRYGTRWLMTSGSCLASLLLLAWASIANLTLFYLIWAGLGIAMAATLYDPAFVLVATWFYRSRTRALTILTFVAGFASVIFVPLAQWLVQIQGWRTALITLALLLGLLTIPPHALLLRRRPQDLGRAPDGGAWPEAVSAASEQSISMKAALREATFWWITTAFALTMLVSGAIAVHLVPYLVDRGYSAGFAASVLGLIGIMALPGRLIFTSLLRYPRMDRRGGESQGPPFTPITRGIKGSGGLLMRARLSRRLVIALLFLLQAISLPALLLLPGLSGVFAFVVLFGASFGAITPARAALIADHYGSSHYARINSVLGLFVTGSRAIAPVGAGIMYDFLGSYPPIFWVLTVISLLAACAIFFVEA